MELTTQRGGQVACSPEAFCAYQQVQEATIWRLPDEVQVLGCWAQSSRGDVHEEGGAETRFTVA
jgi:hypothetical protein